MAAGNPWPGGKFAETSVQSICSMLQHGARIQQVSRKRIVIWVAVGAGALTAVVVPLALHHYRPAWTTIQGAVIRSDEDPRKELPIAGALVTATRGESSLTTQSDASGYFKIAFPGVIWPGQTVLMSFRHSDYQTLNLTLPIQFRSSTKQLMIAAMKPVPVQASNSSSAPQVVVSNLRVRYTVNSQSTQNIGSAVKIFQVVNRENVPCRRQAPCSPDGYWKASTGSAQLDAGPGNEFREARASCIAGPCPFTRIDSSGLTHDGRVITASALDWSDTATFLLEAEVFHVGIGSEVRELYPVIFERTVQFNLPPTEEGVCLEAEVNGVSMVFPLGPDLNLSWATCTERNGSDIEKSTVYQCQLKPGIRF
jgi:hypothetical protein